jgi:hypothetical protein
MSQKKLYVVYILAPLFFLSGCLSTTLRVSSLETSETLGKPLAIDAGIAEGIAPGVDIKTSENDLITETSYREAAGFFGYRMGVGITKNFDLRLDLLMSLLGFDAVSVLQGKYQFLGDSAAEAKAGSYSGSVVLGMGLGGDNPRSYQLESAVIFGYRPIKYFLLYGGPYINGRRYTVPGSAKVHYGSDVMSLNFGIQADVTIWKITPHLGAEASFYSAYYQTLKRQNARAFAVNAGLSF